MRGRKISGRMSKKLVGLFVAVILALVGLSIRITYTTAQTVNNIKMNCAEPDTAAVREPGDPISERRILDRNGNRFWPPVKRSIM